MYAWQKQSKLAMYQTTNITTHGLNQTVINTEATQYVCYPTMSPWSTSMQKETTRAENRLQSGVSTNSYYKSESIIMIYTKLLCRLLRRACCLPFQLLVWTIDNGSVWKTRCGMQSCNWVLHLCFYDIKQAWQFLSGGENTLNY